MACLVNIYQDYFSKIKLEVIPLPPAKSVATLAKRMSPKDAPVLASARWGESDYLITGDKKGFPKSVSKPIIIVSPMEFVENYLPSLISRHTGST